MHAKWSIHTAFIQTCHLRVIALAALFRPGSWNRVWILFEDLPDATCEALWMRTRDSYPVPIIDAELPF